MSAQILVFGDSIAYGAWDEDGGWVERLKCKIHKKVISSGLKFYCDIYNLSIDGDNSANLLKRFEFETEQRMIEEETIVIVAVGMNDSYSAKGKKKTDEECDSFRRNISELIRLSHKLSVQTVFLEIIPVDEEKVNPIPWSGGMVCCKNEYINKYNKALRSACVKSGTDLVDIHDELQKMEYKRLLFDGLHPNSAGHKKIYEIVGGWLEREKII